MTRPTRSEWQVQREWGRPAGDRCGVAVHEMHAEVAEYRLAHDGILPALLAYLRGIFRSAK